MPRRALPAAGLILVAVLGACTYRPEQSKKTPGSATPLRGGTLRIAIADDSAALDPSLAADPGDFALIRATQRGLMAFPSTGETSVPVPDLAAELPQVSADALTYVFRLRDGAAFGPPASRPVTAADVRAGIERSIRLRAPSVRWLGAIASMDAPNERTLVVTLARPYNDLLWLLALPAASAVPTGTPDHVSPDGVAASGPYRIGSREPGRAIRLVRNAAWRQSADPVRPAWVDQIDVIVGESKDADVTGEGLVPPKESRVSTFPSGCLLSLFLNTTSKPLDSVAVRRGIAAAIDRATVVREAAVAGLNSTPAAALLPPGSAGAVARGVPRGDPSKAKPLIGAPFTLAMGRETIGPDAITDAAIAGSLARMLAAAGVTVSSLGAEAPGSIYDRYESVADRVPSGIARWCPDWPGRSGRVVIGALMDGRNISAEGNTDYSILNDDALNRLIDAASFEPDAAKIGPAWTKAETSALALAAVIPLVFLSEAVPISARVKGFAPHPFFLRGDPTALWLEETP